MSKGCVPLATAPSGTAHVESRLRALELSQLRHAAHMEELRAVIAGLRSEVDASGHERRGLLRSGAQEGAAAASESSCQNVSERLRRETETRERALLRLAALVGREAELREDAIAREALRQTEVDTKLAALEQALHSVVGDASRITAVAVGSRDSQEPPMSRLLRGPAVLAREEAILTAVEELMADERRRLRQSFESFQCHVRDQLPTMINLALHNHNNSSQREAQEPQLQQQPCVSSSSLAPSARHGVRDCEEACHKLLAYLEERVDGLSPQGSSTFQVPVT